MTVGNVVALRQQVAVRLLAWSTVAQAGWVLVPLAAAGNGSPGDLRNAFAASIGYLLAYVVASLAAFAVVVLLARHHPAGEEHTLDAYRGLARTRAGRRARCWGSALACLAGLPPGVMGLVAKVVAVRPLVDAELWVFAVVAAVNVAIGLAYYVRLGRAAGRAAGHGAAAVAGDAGRGPRAGRCGGGLRGPLAGRPGAGRPAARPDPLRAEPGTRPFSELPAFSQARRAQAWERGYRCRR